MSKEDPKEKSQSGLASGREMHARLARSSWPLDITTQGLPVRHQPRMSIEKALAARPEVKAADRQD
jgi:hypothetical protein